MMARVFAPGVDTGPRRVQPANDKQTQRGGVTGADNAQEKRSGTNITGRGRVQVASRLYNRGARRGTLHT